MKVWLHFQDCLPQLYYLHKRQNPFTIGMRSSRENCWHLSKNAFHNSISWNSKTNKSCKSVILKYINKINISWPSQVKVITIVEGKAFLKVENIIFAIPGNGIVKGILWQIPTIFSAGPYCDSVSRVNDTISEGSLENASKLSPWKLFLI